MKKLFTFILLFTLFFANAQVFEVQTIQFKGDKSKYINLVIMGDGFTATQQDLFITKAKAASDYVLKQAPWVNYRDYVNVYAIKVISRESGIKHPKNTTECPADMPVSNPDNYFGTTFDVGGIHRLVVPKKNVSAVLAANFPMYDQVVVLGNSTYYGGSGGSEATATIDSASFEVLAHEIGHSFAGLSDEYYAGDGYARENINMTKESNPSLVKWKYWIGASQPNIGVFKHCCGGASSSWYKPTSGTCEMEALGNQFCAVCKEAFVEKIHSITNPIVDYTPRETNINATTALINFNLIELMKPIPNTLNIKWQLDTQVTNSNSQTFQVDQRNLSNGIHTLTATVVDNSSYVKINTHSVHLNSVVWKINKSTLGLNTFALETKSAISIYPNPAINTITIALELDKSTDLAIELTTIEGKLIENYTDKTVDQGKFKETINLENLQNGIYLIVFKIDGVVYSEKIVKQ
jgi:IgA Peptidase M64/Secretion system C-terminal sorting domain